MNLDSKSIKIEEYKDVDNMMKDINIIKSKSILKDIDY